MRKCVANFGEKVIWYVYAYVEQITLNLSLSLTFEGFKTLIDVRNPNPKYYFHLPHQKLWHKEIPIYVYSYSLWPKLNNSGPK